MDGFAHTHRPFYGEGAFIKRVRYNGAHGTEVRAMPMAFVVQADERGSERLWGRLLLIRSWRRLPNLVREFVRFRFTPRRTSNAPTVLVLVGTRRTQYRLPPFTTKCGPEETPESLKYWPIPASSPVTERYPRSSKEYAGGVTAAWGRDPRRFRRRSLTKNINGSNKGAFAYADLVR